MYRVEVGACLVARVVSVVEAAAQEGRDRQDQVRRVAFVEPRGRDEQYR